MYVLAFDVDRYDVVQVSGVDWSKDRRASLVLSASWDATIKLVGVLSADYFILIELVYIELRHLEVPHFVIEESRHLAKGCTAKSDCISLMFANYRMSGRNNMRYKYYRICFGIWSILTKLHQTSFCYLLPLIYSL